MAPKRKQAKPDEKLRRERDALRELVAAQEQQLADAIAHNQSLEAAVLAAKSRPIRKFRMRKLEHGPLQVVIRPVDDVDNTEVEIQHVGESLLILVGTAAQRARGGAPALARAAAAAAPSEAAETPTIDAEPRSGVFRPLTARDVAAIQKMTDVNQAIAYGANFGLDADAAASLAIGATDMTTGLVPDELLAGPPNVVLQPQRPSTSAGGFQLRDEVTAANARAMGWTGIGARPKGWVDPDAPAPAATEH